LSKSWVQKIENLRHAVALHYMHYNVVRRHQTLGVSPTMAEDVTRKLWSIEAMVALID
jgi:hypothetical protein